jgi:putative NADH-flavin reductase
VSVRVVVDLERDAEIRASARWHEHTGGCGHLEIGPDVSLLADSPATWRALAAAATQLADQLAGLYAEHGVDEPAR